jgi:hypothetical protein
MTSSFSSFSSNKRRGTLHDDIDRSVYTVGQTLVSIVNDPRTANQPSSFWGSRADASLNQPPPPIDPVRYPPIHRHHVQPYLNVVHDHLDRFVQDRATLEGVDHPPDAYGSSGDWEQQQGWFAGATNHLQPTVATATAAAAAHWRWGPPGGGRAAPHPNQQQQQKDPAAPGSLANGRLCCIPHAAGDQPQPAPGTTSLQHANPPPPPPGVSTAAIACLGFHPSPPATSWPPLPLAPWYPRTNPSLPFPLFPTP